MFHRQFTFKDTCSTARCPPNLYPARNVTFVNARERARTSFGSRTYTSVPVNALQLLSLTGHDRTYRSHPAKPALRNLQNSCMNEWISLDAQSTLDTVLCENVAHRKTNSDPWMWTYACPYFGITMVRDLLVQSGSYASIACADRAQCTEA